MEIFTREEIKFIKATTNIYKLLYRSMNFLSINIVSSKYHQVMNIG